MRFTPSITLSYHYVIHKAGIPFDIDSRDAEMMKQYGTVEDTEEKEQEQTKEDKPVKKAGRPKKTN